MIDILFTLLPLIIIIACTIIIVTKFKRIQSKEEKDKLSLKMSLGMCFGVSGGLVFSTIFHFDLALSMSIGTLIAATLALFITE